MGDNNYVDLTVDVDSDLEEFFDEDEELEEEQAFRMLTYPTDLLAREGGRRQRDCVLITNYTSSQGRHRGQQGSQAPRRHVLQAEDDTGGLRIHFQEKWI